MVSNFERIFDEITKQASRAPGDFAPETLVELAMEIVDREDQHATRQTSINKIVEYLIEQAANVGDPA